MSALPVRALTSALEVALGYLAAGELPDELADALDDLLTVHALAVEVMRTHPHPERTP